MTSSLDMIRGRSNVVTLTNNSGGALVAGDVCIQDTTGNEYVTTTTSANSTKAVFIAAESIANAATGKFYASGYCPLVTPSASVTRGRYLFTHTVAKQAAENATYGAGAFGVILTSGTTPTVWLFGETSQGNGGAGSDTTAIHDNVASEISAVTEKASPVSGDLLLIEDSADSNNKKRVQIGNLPTGSDSAAIHDNVAGEIAAITEKASPIDADLLLIEDSADSNNKKRVQIGNLPGGTGGIDFLVAQVFS